MTTEKVNMLMEYEAAILMRIVTCGAKFNSNESSSNNSPTFQKDTRASQRQKLFKLDSYRKYRMN